MIVLEVLAIAVPVLMGFLICCTVFPCRALSSLNVALGVGMGTGIYSCCYFVCMLFPSFSATRFFMLELGLLAISFVCFSWARTSDDILIPPDNLDSKNAISGLSRILAIGFYCALLLMVGTFVLRTILLPQGGWDAWQTWNLLARIMSRGGDRWTSGFSPILAPQHPDYPLLVPSLIARGWRYAGRESFLTQALVSATFSFATVGLLFSALSLLKDRSQGLLSGLILVGTPAFIVLGASQYADIPLGFFFLASFVVLALQDSFPTAIRLSFLAGVMAGFSSWTKNEGLLFLLAIVLSRFVAVAVGRGLKSAVKEITALVSGMASVFIIVLYFKVSIAPPNDVMSAQKYGYTIRRLLHFSNYPLILKAFINTPFTTMPFLVLLLVYPAYVKCHAVPAAKITATTGFITLSLMLAGYFFIYVITPHDINWHIQTSLSRLVVQLWPSFLFLYFLVIRTPRQALEAFRTAKVTL